MSEQMECVGSDLCQELRGSNETSFDLVYQGDPASRYVAGTANFRLIADLSPLTLGHLLLLPVDHYLSFAAMVDEYGDEIERILTPVLPRYRTTFGDLTIMEHGSSKDTHAACITHAHWHLVSAPYTEVARIVVGDGMEPFPIETFRDLGAALQDDRAYYYCSDGTRHLVFGVGHRMRSQYLRSVIGRVIGIPDPLWDYSVVVRKELLRETMVRVKSWQTELEMEN
jgi:diadenosine tetraphosphate (Ap4A) HIT family hydrolase